MFVFFHDGAAVDRLLATQSGMNGLVQEIANGPAVSYGFLGSYFFAIWFLFKRYISGDLGPGAFLHVSVRAWLGRYSGSGRRGGDRGKVRSE